MTTSDEQPSRSGRDGDHGLSAPTPSDARPVERSAGAALVGPAEYLAMLGNRVRLLRHGRGLTQNELAAAAGMPVDFVAQVERGTARIEIIRLSHLAAALRVTLPQLVHGIHHSAGRAPRPEPDGESGPDTNGHRPVEP